MYFFFFFSMVSENLRHHRGGRLYLGVPKCWRQRGLRHRHLQDPSGSCHGKETTGSWAIDALRQHWNLRGLGSTTSNSTHVQQDKSGKTRVFIYVIFFSLPSVMKMTRKRWEKRLYALWFFNDNFRCARGSSYPFHFHLLLKILLFSLSLQLVYLQLRQTGTLLFPQLDIDTEPKTMSSVNFYFSWKCGTWGPLFYPSWEHYSANNARA